jgi:hypothetical protein
MSAPFQWMLLLFEALKESLLSTWLLFERFQQPFPILVMSLWSTSILKSALSLALIYVQNDHHTYSNSFFQYLKL